MTNIAGEIKSVDDAMYFAERRLPKFARIYFRAGSGTKQTMATNTEAFSKVTFRPSAGTCHPARDLSTTIVGHKIAFPLMIAPTGGARLAHPEAEKAGVRAAGSAGTIQWVSTFSGVRIEDVMAVATTPVFFQLYYPGSLEAAEDLIDRVKLAGCSALVLTVDTAVGPRPEVPARGRITLYRAGGTGRRPLMEYVRIGTQLAASPRWTSTFLRDRGRGMRAAMVEENGKSALMFRASEVLMKRTPVWADIPRIKDRWGGPLIIKGILTPEDARKAVDLGADAIVVSNHGGNILDGNPSTISMLPSIVDAVGDATEILMDSGIRRGSDVVKALAIGARAVLIGRSWLWGLAAAGEEGVAAVLEVYRKQIDDTIGGLGCASVADLSRNHVSFPAEWSSR